MAEKEVRIHNIVDTRQNWTRLNPVLLEGEIGLEIMPISSINKNNFSMKIGDGMTEWNRLPYISFENQGNTFVYTMTKSEYDAIEEKDNKTMYIVDDGAGTVKQYLGSVELAKGESVPAGSTVMLKSGVIGKAGHMEEL